MMDAKQHQELIQELIKACLEGRWATVEYIRSQLPDVGVGPDFICPPDNQRDSWGTGGSFDV